MRCSPSQSGTSSSPDFGFPMGPGNPGWPGAGPSSGSSAWLRKGAVSDPAMVPGESQPPTLRSYLRRKEVGERTARRLAHYRLGAWSDAQCTTAKSPGLRHSLWFRQRRAHRRCRCFNIIIHSCCSGNNAHICRTTSLSDSLQRHDQVECMFTIKNLAYTILNR